MTRYSDSEVTAFESGTETEFDKCKEHAGEAVDFLEELATDIYDYDVGKRHMEAALMHAQDMLRYHFNIGEIDHNFPNIVFDMRKLIDEETKQGC